MAGRWTANVTRSMLSPSFRVERATLEFAVSGDTMAATGDTLLISDKRFTKARHFRSTATSTPSGGVRSDLAFSSRRYLDRANDEVVLLDRKDQTGAELRHQLRQGGTPQFYFLTASRTRLALVSTSCKNLDSKSTPRLRWVCPAGCQIRRSDRRTHSPTRISRTAAPTMARARRPTSWIVESIKRSPRHQRARIC